MAAWMLYALASGAVLAAVGLLSERGVAQLGGPARWPWIAVMTVSASWPFLVAGRSAGGGPVSPGTPGGPGSELGAEGVSPWRAVAADLSGSVPDAWLAGGWLLASSALLTLLLLSARAVRADGRAWRLSGPPGEPIFLSRTLGPGVVGAVRPRIVLPAWVLDLDEPLRQVIVEHEREHLRAGDSRLAAAGILLLVVLPWCVPLWWQFHRLRLAIETDCDRRVLRRGAPPRTYAEALLAVAGRRTARVPLTPMASARAALERRIRLIVRAPSRGTRRSGAVWLTLATVVPAIATTLPAPSPPSPATMAMQLRTGPPGALPDGSLPGDPGEARLAEAIRVHHPEAAATGLAPESVIWFVVDDEGVVQRTGIERGTDREVEARVRARYPNETSSRAVLSFEGQFAGIGEANVIWLLPEP